tara:strand:+ start:144 stop:392 length:249 start_codon:yes stop_codon:yes gene_type:complete
VATLLYFEFNDQKIDDKVRECKAIVCEHLNNPCGKPVGEYDKFHKNCKYGQEAKEQRCFNELKELDPESKYVMPRSPLSCNP